MTTVVPLVAVPAQKQSIPLGGQNAGITVYMMGSRLYFDLTLDDAPVVSAVLCQDRVKLVGEVAYGFSGDLAFIDTQGTNDPTYDGLGDRYQLVYLP
jgi:hypothetical protein